jgi:NCAIR mutase (PurE)-related protein
VDLNDVLERLAAGGISVSEAQQQLAAHGIFTVGDFARLDTGRHSRKGVPEVVYAPGKTPEQLTGICDGLLERNGSAIISGLEADHRQSLESRFAEQISVDAPEAKTMVIRQPGNRPEATGGVVGLLAAGTADVPVAEQAAIMAAEMGSTVIKAFDVGVAGVHRLVEPLREITEAGAASIVVAAGMEGALPSVVAGLVALPVIGLPTSTGYGMGGGGVAALMAMLQSCSPGLVVVNIDNGIGAGATAALIANTAARRPDRS